MKRKFLLLIFLMVVVVMQAASDVPTVTVVYSGNSASVVVDDEIAEYITVNSGTSSHVSITSLTNSVEIFYNLSGSSDDGEFLLVGDYKCEIDLTGLTLTNPSGPALNLQNGKRITVSAKKNTTNSLTDGKNADYKGCIHCTGHLEFKGKGELTVVGNSKHAISSDEYVEIKNLTLNITGAVKDGIHCKQYFLMESGNVTISNVGDDGIQCELEGETSTGEIVDHEDEDTGNVYLLDGTLTIQDYGGKAIKADGSIFNPGGTQNFDMNDTTGITVVKTDGSNSDGAIYDIRGQRVTEPTRGIYIQDGKKFVVK
ncbi:MAG: carbohydrate-binding domain-containing protein [Prevotella sp.]|nr:carbohydrate-binding domain-containing protein [Prevotella sp.]